MRDPGVASEWLSEWLADGTLASAAWSGHERLPCRGLYRILERLGFPIESSIEPKETSATG